MIRRIDLRGAAAPDDYRAAVPRADFDVEAAVQVGARRSARRSATAGVEAIREYSQQFDGVDQTDIAVPAAGARRRARRRSTPPSGPGSRSRSAGSALTCEAELEHDVVTELGAGRHGHPPQWCRSTGSGSTSPAAWRRWSPACVMNVVPAQVAGVALDRADLARRSRSTAGCRTRRSWPRARCSASTRCTPSAAPRRSRCSPTAPGPCRRVDLVTGPGQHLHRQPPSGCSRAWSASTPRPARPRSRSSPTTLPTRRTSPPTWSARPSTTRWPPACWSPPRSGSPTRSRPSSTSRSPATKHAERIRAALGGRQSGIVLVDDLEQGLEVVNAYAAEHLEIHTARRRRGRRPGAQRRRDLRRPVRPGLARRLLRRLQPRAADRRLRLPLLGPVGARVPQGGARRRLRPATRWPRSPTTSSRWPRPRTCPATAPRSASRFDGWSDAMTDADRGVAAAARGAARPRALRRAAARRAGPAQRQREPLPAVAGWSSPTSRAPSPRPRRR